MNSNIKIEDENQTINNLYSEVSEDTISYKINAEEGITENAPPKLSRVERLKRKKGVLGILGAALAFLLKFKFIILKLKFLFIFLKLGKILSTFGSMVFAIFVYAKIYGLIFGIGFILLLFAHEMGHYIAAKKIKLPVSAPIFIPFVGALISMKELPKNAKDEAFMAAAGPVVGSIAALLCIPLYLSTGNRVFMALAYTGFFLNLFNLIPVHPLDGGRIVTAISPKLWFLGIPLLTAAAIKFFNPVIIIFLILGISELYKYYKNPKKEYYEMPTSTKLIFTLVYFGLIAVLGASSAYIHSFIPLAYR